MGTTASAAAGAEPADRSAFHLPGHPLPALVELASTDEQERKMDLFMTSLSRPILLTTFAAHGAPQLLALKEHLAQLRAHSPQLAVFCLRPPCSVVSLGLKRKAWTSHRCRRPRSI